MTSQNSFIFSSKQFLVLAGSVALVTALLLSSVSYIGMRQGLLDFAFNDLYQYQLHKLESQHQVDIVFLGDSSLGNAIDANYLSYRTGKSVVNLALTGAYGYGGTYNMLRRAVTHWRPTVVVIMQTPDMLMRPQIYEGFIHTVVSDHEVFNAPPTEVIAVVANIDNVTSIFRRYLRGGLGNNTNIKNDYIPQTSELSSQDKLSASKGSEYSSRSIKKAHLKFIKKIADYCRATKTACFYSHGPWFVGLCTKSGEYLSEASRQIELSGLRVLPGNPVCLPSEDVGDSFDHVKPSRKKYYTSLYLMKLLKSGFIATKGRQPPAPGT